MESLENALCLRRILQKALFRCGPGIWVKKTGLRVDKPPFAMAAKASVGYQVGNASL
ncbi:MAG: hypothetical protein ACLUAR_17445 [Pilosibacter sp.]